MIRPLSHALIGCISALSLTACGDDSPAGPDTPAPQGNKGITILSPNGGESFQVGSSLRVKWTTNSGDLTTARILASCNGTSWYDLKTTSSIAWSLGDTTFTIPDSVYDQGQKKMIGFPTGSGCKVKMMDYTILDAFDVSDAPFEIKSR